MSAKPLSNDDWLAEPDDLSPTQTGFVSASVRRLGSKVPDNSLRVDVVTQDLVAQETPVALVFNGVSHAVMLASPRDLEDFARGFALSEGIVDSPSQIYGIEVNAVVPVGQSTETLAGYEVQIDIASAAFVRLKEKRRNLTGRTGCGLCGTESLDQVLRPLPDVPVTKHVVVDAEVIDRALKALPQFQEMQHLTGATHAAAWFSPDGELLLLREDVGRHNALDKLIGAGLGAEHQKGQTKFGEGFVLVTSRASMEMVQKTLAAGFAMLVAVSAPTSLAIDIARRHGLALVGFARPGRCSVYNAPAGVRDKRTLRGI